MMVEKKKKNVPRSMCARVGMKTKRVAVVADGNGRLSRMGGGGVDVVML